NYRGLSLDKATEMLKAADIKYEIVGSGASVIDQVPVSNATVTKKYGKVILYTENISQSDSVTVPDVIGKTAEEANVILTDAGLNILIDGRASSGATVAAQSVPKGGTVPRGTIVKISMRFTEETE
ncbi:MAG: PASTA domain-containing protein, partial [Clostridia bacterium]|nr:PASTA domain-containing protein [Clostridia bacterium]